MSGRTEKRPGMPATAILAGGLHGSPLFREIQAEMRAEEADRRAEPRMPGATADTAQEHLRVLIEIADSGLGRPGGGMLREDAIRRVLVRARAALACVERGSA